MGKGKMLDKMEKNGTLPPPMFPAKSGLKIRKTSKRNIYEKYFKTNKD